MKKCSKCSKVAKDYQEFKANKTSFLGMFTGGTQIVLCQSCISRMLLSCKKGV